MFRGQCSCACPPGVRLVPVVPVLGRCLLGICPGMGWVPFDSVLGWCRYLGISSGVRLLPVLSVYPGMRSVPFVPC